MAIEKEIIIKVDNSSAVKGIKEVDTTLKNTSKSTKETTEGLDVVKGKAMDAVGGFKIMGVSLNSLIGYLKLFKITLISTGIGAIVVAVGALSAAFLSTQAGVDKLNSVLIPLKEVLATIWGIAQKLGTGLFEMVNGDVQKGWQTMGKAVENVGDQMKTAYENGQRLYDLQIQIRQNNISDGLVISRLNRLRADQLEIAEDINNTEEERKKAFKAAIASEEAITKLKKRQNELLIEEAERKTRANDTDDEAKRALNELIAQGEDIEAQGIKSRTLLLKKLNAVKGEGAKIDKPTEQTFEEFERENEAIRKKIEQDKQERIRQAEQRLKDAQDLEAYYEELEQIEIDVEDRRIQREYAEKQRKEKEAADDIKLKQQVEDAKYDIANQGFNLVGMLAKKGSKLAKGAAVAQATISGYQGVQNAFTTAAASPITTLFPAYPFIQAGLAGAFSALQIAKILSAKETGASSNSTSSSAGVSSPSFNLVQGTGTNQITQSLTQQNQTPIKAYVVSSDVTTAQSLDRNTITGASL